jgi:hypothetical protein
LVVHGSGKADVPRTSGSRRIRWSAPVLGLLGLLGLLLLVLLLLLLLKLCLSENLDLILLRLKTEDFHLHHLHLQVLSLLDVYVWAEG